MTYEIYSFSPSSSGAFHASSLEDHLKATGLIARAFRKEDELIQGWLKDPATYPDELRDKDVILWGSVETCCYPSSYWEQAGWGPVVYFLTNQQDKLMVRIKWINRSERNKWVDADDCWCRRETVSLLKPA